MDQFNILKNVIIPVNDENFTLSGMETYTDGYDEHLVDDIKEIFTKRKIEIEYEKKDSILAIMILYKRISDIYFEFEKIRINGKEIKINQTKSKKVDDVEIVELISFEELIDNISIGDLLKSKKIEIEANEENIKYAKQVLIYTDNKKRGEDYNFLRELDR